MKDHSIALKAFSKSIKRSNPGICFDSAYLIMQSRSLMFSAVNMPFIYSVWSLLTKPGKKIIKRSLWQQFYNH